MGVVRSELQLVRSAVEGVRSLKNGILIRPFRFFAFLVWFDRSVLVYEWRQG